MPAPRAKLSTPPHVLAAPTAGRGPLLLGALLLAVALLVVPTDAAAQSCDICTACDTDADCTTQGSVCRDMGTSGRRCTQTCTAGSCPGDSVCYTLTIGANPPEMLCVAPDGSCTSAYQCMDDGDPCTGLGTDCSAGPSVCQNFDAFTCLTVTDQNGTRSYCTCECTSLADCGGNGSCGTAGGGQMFCFADTVTGGPCDGVTCSGGETCNPNTGMCEQDLCANVNCAPPRECDPGTGNCVDPNDLCANVMCTGGAVCSPATGTCIGGGDTGGDTTADTSPPQDTGSADVVNPPQDTGMNTSSTSADTSMGSDTSVPPGVFTLTTIRPSMGANDTDLLVQINGTGFVAGMTLRLGVTSLVAVTVASPTFATATVPSGIAPGVYDLIGQLPSGSVFTLPSAYQVTAAGTGDPMGGGGSGDEGCGCSIRDAGDTAPGGAAALVALLGLGLVAWRRRR